MDTIATLAGDCLFMLLCPQEEYLLCVYLVKHKFRKRIKITFHFICSRGSREGPMKWMPAGAEVFVINCSVFCTDAVLIIKE